MTLMHALQGERHRAVTTQQLPNGFTRRLAMVLGVVICLVVALGARQRSLAETLEHEPSDPITFAAIGDFGEDSATHTQVADLIKSWNPDLIITMGDNRCRNNTFDTVVGKRYCDYLSNVQAGTHCQGGHASENRFFPSIGNHDYSDGGGSTSIYAISRCRATSATTTL